MIIFEHLIELINDNYVYDIQIFKNGFGLRKRKKKIILTRETRGHVGDTRSDVASGSFGFERWGF